MSGANLELFTSHTRAAAIMKTMHSNDSAEWYSRPDHVERARMAFGPFDFDPASSALANAVIGATWHGGRQEDGSFVDGLAVNAWKGHGWINAPSPVVIEDPATKKRTRVPGTGPKWWWKRLVHDVEAGHTTRATYVVYSIEQLQQSQRWAGGGILAFADAVCFPRERVKYYRLGESGALEEGDIPSHASAYACIVGGLEPAGRSDSPRRNGLRMRLVGAERAAVEAWCDLFASLGTVVVER